MNEQNLKAGNIEVYQQKYLCRRCSVVKNRANARKRQSISMNGHKILNQNYQNKLSLLNLK